MEAYIASIFTDESSSATPMSEITDAGDSFGWRSEKLRNKVNNSWLVWCSIRYMLGVMCKINMCYNPKYNYNQTHDTTNYLIIGDITTYERQISSTERKVRATSREPYHGRCEMDNIAQYCDGIHNRNNCHHIHTLKWRQDIIGIHIKFSFHKQNMVCRRKWKVKTFQRYQCGFPVKYTEIQGTTKSTKSTTNNKS